MKRILSLLCACLLVLSCTAAAVSASAAESAQVTVDKNNITHEVSDMLYGIFIEDISNAVEGGLCANLVRNNSFEYEHFDNSLSGWEINSDYTKETKGGMNDNNKTYIHLSDISNATIKNSGFCEYYDYKTYDKNEEKIASTGMGFTQGEVYEFSAWFKNTDTVMSVWLEDTKGNAVSESANIRVSAKEWTKVTLELTADKTVDGKLAMKFEKGDVSLDFVNLYPKNSFGFESENWKYTSLRSDLFAALKALNPAFVRFPGGCVTEGDSLETLFDWKSTIGPIEERRQTYNLWRNDVIDYNNSFAVGYHEYFELCDELDAKPLPILNVGLICQGRCGYNETAEKLKNGEITKEQWEEYLDTIALRPGTVAFEKYAQDILDLIEYANGDTSTVWGAKRAENGHKEPFGLEYIGLGNENWGEVYFRNFDALKKAVNEKHPEIKIISSSGPWSDGAEFDMAWEEISKNYTDTIVDEHYYRENIWYLENTHRYDSYDRNGAKVFLGEYAATAKGIGTKQTKSNIAAAVSEAAYMTGLERNGDIVQMASYAPTFAKNNADEWSINMIWFDSHEAVLTPTYYNQLLFMNNTGTKYLETSPDMEERGIFSSVTVDEENETIYIKLVNTAENKQSFTFDFKNFGDVSFADVLTLSHSNARACNEVGSTTIVPEADVPEISDSLTVTADKNSVNVIRVAYGSNKDGAGFAALPDTPETKPFMTDVQKVLVWAVPLLAVVLAAVIVLVLRKKKK